MNVVKRSPLGGAGYVLMKNTNTGENMTKELMRE
jgi:hypothetical protein